jgi:hypothetical protein
VTYRTYRAVVLALACGVIVAMGALAWYRGR